MRPFGSVIGALNLPTTKAAPGCWKVNEIAKAARSQGAYQLVSWPGPADPNFSTVKALFHFERMNGKGALLDSCGNGDGVLIPNSSTISGMANDITPKFGSFCLFVSTSGANGPGVQIVGVGGFNFGTADFTMEGFFYQTTGGSLQILLDTRQAGTNGVTPTIYINASNQLSYFQNSADRITGATTVTQNAWHHFAASRVSGSTYLYLDGVQEGSTYTDANNYVGTALYIGTGGAPSSPLRGYMDEVRVNKGHGYYSGASFTVPTAPFPDY